jgi:alpha/beta superfamily hydrolase
MAAFASTLTRTARRSALAARPRSKAEVLFTACVAVLALHLLLDAFFDLGPERRPDGELMLGLISAPIILGTAVLHPRVGTGARAGLALVVGLFAVISNVPSTVAHAAILGFDAGALTGLAGGFAGFLLIGLGITLAGGLIRRRWLRVFILLPACLVALVYVAFPLTIAVFLTNVPRVPLGDETPADHGLRYETVAFQNEDGLTIRGWYIPSQNGAAIVAVHGAIRGRTTTMDHAAMLARHGYGVLMIDLQGYGESEGEPIAIGWTGPVDVAAAVTYLTRRPDVQPGRIGGLGLSLGGEVLVQSQAEDRRIGAVVAEGVETRTFKEQMQAPGGWDKWVIAPNSWMMVTATALLSSEPPAPSLKDLVPSIAPRPLLVVSTGSGAEGDWGRVLQENAGPGFELWETGVGHTAAFREFPEAYETRVTEFFDSALLQMP